MTPIMDMLNGSKPSTGYHQTPEIVYFLNMTNFPPMPGNNLILFYRGFPFK
ncbi:MAG TPA: hypothetical protein VK166_01275 [Chitinophagaceae bacterium]|nr:hypothetical protein [Chitinophagaceae bacterium]